MQMNSGGLYCLLVMAAYLDCYDRFYSKRFPKGVKHIDISLKCCLPKGIPMMVMQSSRPNIRWVRAIHRPPHSIHRILSRVVKQPVFCPLALALSTIFNPKGAKVAMPILMHCIPKGIPTMVQHSISPPRIYSKAAMKPPKISQIKFPIRFM